MSAPPTTLALACGAIALVLSCAGCQLLMDDLPSKRAHEDGGTAVDAGDVDADAGDPADGSDITDASDNRDAVSGDAEIDATPGPDAAEPDAAEPDAAEPDAAKPDVGTPLPDADARAPDPEACDGAGERTFYADGDEDGYGDPTQLRFGCEAPDGYVDRAGDCHDGNEDVHEGQAAFFGVGYSRPDLTIPSFDYDCDDVETFGPLQRLQACSSGLLACSGGGYDVNNQRAGFPGLNPYCGSTDFLNCEGLPLVSGCNGDRSTASEPFTCK